MDPYQDPETDEEKLFNVTYFIDNHGDVLGSYQKKNLWYSCSHLIRQHECLSPHTWVLSDLSP